MANLRSLLIALAGVAFIMSACGDETPPGGGGGSDGAGGSGGTGGAGGSGGGGGPGTGGNPAVHGIDPESAGPGFRVKVLGENLGRSGPKNSLFFVATEGSDQPTLEAKGVNADSEGGTWFEVAVPMNAKSGPTLVTVDTDEGRVTLSGPEFTVTDDKLPPAIVSLNPSTITAGERDVRITVTGAGFYPNVTTLLIDDVEHPIDWSSSTMTRLYFNLPAEKAAEVGNYVTKLITPPPGGGESSPHIIRVVPAVNLVKAEAVAPRALHLTFDQVLGNVDGRDFSIAGVSRAIRTARLRRGNPMMVEVELRRRLQEGRTYTVRVNERFTSAAGGEIRNREADFTAWVDEDP